MRKILFFSTLALLAIGTSKAQLKPSVEKRDIKKSAPAPAPAPPPAPAPAPPPAPVNKTTGTENTTVLEYRLTSVRVKIRTGNDNKEFPSIVEAWVAPMTVSPGTARPFIQLNMKNEMRINTVTEFGLQETGGSRELRKLDTYQSSGVRLTIYYGPNFFADAWKIESVTLVLEFRDQFGNLHPTLGSKTIVFDNAYGFLNTEYRVMECTTDRYFVPLTANIKKW